MPRTTLSLVVLATALAATTACKSELDGKARAQVQDAPAGAKDAAPAAKSAARTLDLDAAQSKIAFVGAKVTADHRGTFAAPTGSLKLDAEGKPVALDVTVETTKIDIEPAKLKQHLQSPDFFDTAKYPKAHFHLTQVAPANGGDATHTVTGELELRGVKKQISFPANVDLGADKASATASFKINRKDFGIVYTGMADDLIKDDVLLELDLAFQPAAAS